MDEVNRRDNGTLSALQKSVFNLLYKVESRFDHDSVTYKKEINTFVKQTDKINGKHFLHLQKMYVKFWIYYSSNYFKKQKKNKAPGFWSKYPR